VWKDRGGGILLAWISDYGNGFDASVGSEDGVDYGVEAIQREESRHLRTLNNMG
jgi:hypothetical protein